MDKGSSHIQYFWEAFPASDGPSHRTTYMFAYLDADPARPSVSSVLEDYLDLMPAYQGVDPQGLKFERVLAGFFPTYKRSPLKTPFPRICPIGDASGIQSPLSFGGFGALTRHLPRLVAAFSEALEHDALGKRHLQAINGYQPALSASWLFQRSMSVKVGSRPFDPLFINRLLSSNFQSMSKLGDSVLKPFLQGTSASHRAAAHATMDASSCPWLRI
jgi:flavin-dependent dehydrogenase